MFLTSTDFYSYAVLILIDLAVFLVVFEVTRFLVCTCLEVRLNGIKRMLARAIHRRIDVFRQFVHCLGELLGNIRTFFWRDLHDIIAILVAPGKCLADDILWMVLEILVDRHATIRISAPIRLCEHLREVLEILRVRRLHLVLAALAEDDDIRADTRARIVKRAGRQLVRRHHVRFLAEVGAHPCAVLAIRERALRCDIHHEAAGTHLVHAVSEEVIVDSVTCDAEVCIERNIGNHEVVEVVRELCFLESRMFYKRAWIEHTRDPRGQTVNLDTAQAGVLHHVARHAAKEIANAHGRIKHAPAGKAKTRNAFPYSPDDCRRGIKGVIDCALCGLILFRCKDCTQLLIHFCVEERVFKTAPAVIVAEDILFLRRRHTVVRLQLLQELDGVYVLLETHRRSLLFLVRLDLIVMSRRLLRRRVRLRLRQYRLLRSSFAISCACCRFQFSSRSYSSGLSPCGMSLFSTSRISSSRDFAVSTFCSRSSSGFSPSCSSSFSSCGLPSFTSCIRAFARLLSAFVAMVILPFLPIKELPNTIIRRFNHGNKGFVLSLEKFLHIGLHLIE